MSINLQNWIPKKIIVDNKDILCQWFFTGNKKFVEPFLDETISACLQFSENFSRFKSCTDINFLNEYAINLNSISPTAIIFHISRCGSTLLSQLLSLPKENIVLSEVPFFDDVLRLKNIDEQIILSSLQSSIAFYAQKKREREKHLFIKTDSWHIHFYEVYRKLFPTIPFIFLFRNPYEVLLSQQKKRGMHAVPNLIDKKLFNFSATQLNEINLDKYLVNVLSSYFKKMIAIAKADTNVRLYNYNDGIANIAKDMYKSCNLYFTNELKTLFAKRINFDAKEPTKIFKEEKTVEELPDFILPSMQSYNELDLLKSIIV